MSCCLKSDLLTDPAKTYADEISKLETKELLDNYDYFKNLSTQIFTIFQNANFCKETRLMSNVVYTLLKDLMEIYRFYHNHITELLERFPTFTSNQATRAFRMYKNFVTLTEALKNKGNKLIYLFNFPLTLPDFYKPDVDLMDTLEAIVASLQD